MRFEAVDGRKPIVGAEMAVPDRHQNTFVPGQLLHRSKVHASHDETADVSVPEHVPGDIC